MKKYLSLVFTFCLIISFNCTNAKIKLKPDDHHFWEICKTCKGLGTVTSLKSKSSPDDVTDNPGNKYGFCIFPFLLVAAIGDNDVNKEKTRREYNRGFVHIDPEKNLDVMEQRVPERSVVKRIVKCPFCDGKGWTVTETPDSSMVIIKKKSELTEKDFILK